MTGQRVTAPTPSFPDRWRLARTIASVGIIASVLAGCATGDESGAFDDVQAMVAERTRTTVPWHRGSESRKAADYRVRQIRGQELGVDAAVELAFLRNPSIQSDLAMIGIAEADVTQAGRMANPVVSLSRVAAGGSIEIERQFLFSLVSLFTIGPRTEIAQDKAEQARYRTALNIVTAAGGVRQAWVEAVAARERVGLMEKVRDSAIAARDLGKRMADAGSMTPIDQAKINAYEADVAAQLARLRTAEETSREKLVRAVGVWGPETGFRLPARLTGLPARTKRLADIEKLALSKRLDVRAARKEVDQLGKTVDLTAFTGIINLLAVSGYVNKEVEKEEDGKTVRHPKGIELEFVIPIFDPGDAAVSRAKWTYLKSIEDLRALAVSARSEAREAYLVYRGAYDLAKHYRDAVLPLNARVTREELLRYNGMLASVFDLLAASRQEAQAAMTALDARRDFWLADAQLDLTLLGGSGIGGGPDTEVAMSVPGSGAEH